MTLMLTVIEAKLIRDTETFGKMDPFTTILHRDVKYKTKVLEDAGFHPKWNEIIEISNIESLDDNLVITVYDEDFMTDDFVG